MHPSGGNASDNPPIPFPNQLTGISLDPEVLGHYRNTLFTQQGLQQSNGAQHIQFLAQLSHQQQQTLINQLQSTIMAQGGKIDPMAAIHQQIAQEQHKQAMLRHHHQHQQQVERLRERGRGPPVLANHQIDEQNHALTVTFTTLVGTTSVTVPLQRAATFTRVQNPHISSLFLEQILTQHQLVNPLHCHRIEVPGIDGGLVYYHPMALTNILKGVLEQIDIMHKTIYQIGSTLPNPVATRKLVANNILDIQAQTAGYHRKLSEARRRNSMPVQNIQVKRNPGHKEDGTPASLIVPEPTLLSPRGSESVRDVPVVTVPTSMIQGYKRPPPNNGEHDASKGMPPDFLQQMGQLASIRNFQSSAQYAAHVQGMIDTITASLNNANHIIPPTAPPAGNEPPLGSQPDVIVLDDGKAQKRRSSGAADYPLGQKLVKLEDIYPDKRIIEEPNRRIMATTTTLIDQGTAQRPSAAGEKEILDRTLPKISTEEQTATEVLLRLRNQQPPLSKMARTSESNVFVDVASLTLDEQACLPAPPTGQNMASHELLLRRIMDHQCSSKCNDQCIGLVGPTH